MGSPERVAKRSLRPAVGLVFVSDILEPIFLDQHPPHKRERARHLPAPNRLQPARAAERTYREKKEQQCQSRRGGNQPVGHVAGPGAQSHIQPREAQNGEDAAGQFQKKLVKRAPKTAETSRARGG